MNTEGMNMKLSKEIQYANAYQDYLNAQYECPHWDEETPNGIGLKCCWTMYDAKKNIRKLKNN